ncbi:MAG: alpha/beta hydrolase [bacterium]
MWHKIPEICRILVIGAAGFYIIILLYFGFFQTRLVFFPSGEILGTPENAGLEYEDVYFKSADGQVLHGWFIPAPAPSDNPRGVLLFCHGNAGNISGRIESVSLFHNLGLSVFIFDYRGYGKSRGKPAEKGTYLDAAAAWDYLVKMRKIGPEKIIVFGRSLGGAIAARLARERACGGVIIESAFTSVKDIGSEMYPYLPVRMLSRFGYETKEYISGVKYPVLIVHSRDDEMMPFNHGARLFEAAPEPKEFLAISGSHNDGFLVSGEKYTAGIDSFISKYFTQKRSK